MISHDEARTLIRTHFGLDIAPHEERELRLHLADCAQCAGLYDRHLLVATLDPKAKGAKQRLAKGLGLRPPGKPFALPLQIGLAVVAVVALVLFGVDRPDEFAARGSQAATHMAEVFVYRVSPGQRSQAVAGRIRASDELAFAYVNAAGFSRLMIFGQDEHGRVYWYHPAWSNQPDNPGAIAIEAGAQLRELPESVRHDVDGKTLKIHALFSNVALSVRDVERMLAAQRALPLGKVARSLAARIGDAREIVVPLKVE